jgi:hypothetical protein
MNDYRSLDNNHTYDHILSSKYIYIRQSIPVRYEYYSATLYGHQQINVDHQHFLLEASRKLSLTRTPPPNRLNVWLVEP